MNGRPGAMRGALLAVTLLLLTGCGSTMLKDASVTVESWGEVDGAPVALYTLDNGRIRASITNFGATVTELLVPDRAGDLGDIVLGFDSLEGYRTRSPYFGCTVGRVGNRIANGAFSIDGERFQLLVNNGPHQLHGGPQGFDKVVWRSDHRMTEEGPQVRLTHRSPDGDQGYPGEVRAEVIYTLTADDELRVEMSAWCDRRTPVNIVHHSYWNLAGHASGDILAQELRLHAERYTPTDATLIPTGAIDPVAGTPFDFRISKPIGADIGELPPKGDDPGGYDLNFVVNGEPGTMRAVSRAVDPASGRVMEIESDAPGVQFYSGNFLDGITGKGGAVYAKHGGFCLETQIFPDAVNRQGTPGWPPVLLSPDEEFRHVMIHRFSTERD